MVGVGVGVGSEIMEWTCVMIEMSYDVGMVMGYDMPQSIGMAICPGIIVSHLLFQFSERVEQARQKSRKLSQENQN